MPSNPQDRASGGSAPSMLDLVRLSRRSLFPPGGVELYRQIALLTDLAPDVEVLDVACGPGVCLEYFVTEFGVDGSGVDYDATMVEAAETRARDAELTERMHLQHGALDALPYRDETFDVVVGELGLSARADPSAAVEELVRVTRPGGRVVLVQLVWKAPVEQARRDVLADHLGARPLMLVEWKRILLENGVENLHTEDWSDEETAFRPRLKKPFPDFSELFSLPEKLGILRRAWGRWGFQGVRTAISREFEVHRVLTRERILGLDLVIGTKAARPDGDAASTDRGAESPPEAGRDAPGPSGAGSDVESAPERPGTPIPSRADREVEGTPPPDVERSRPRTDEAPRTLARPDELSQDGHPEADTGVEGAADPSTRPAEGRQQPDSRDPEADVEGLPLFTRDDSGS